MFSSKNCFTILMTIRSGSRTTCQKNFMTFRDISKEELIQNFKKLPEIQLNDRPVTKHAAVLIALCESHEKVSLLYTLRSSLMKNHTRQVSFPGGIMDSRCDNGFEECALRETDEETGIPNHAIEVWGCGNPLVPFKPIDQEQMQIVPVIGVIRRFHEISIKPNRNEVEKVFTVDLERLIDSQYRKHTQFQSGRGYSTPIFIGGEERIWGMTAILTHLFLTALLPKEMYSRKIPYVQPYKVQYSNV